MYFDDDQITIQPKWRPEEAEGRSFRYRLTKGERKRFKKRKPIPPSVWAERHRVVTKSSIPGKWKNRTTPYLAGIMDASYHRSVEKITVVAAPQVGKSEFVNNCIAYAIDRDPMDVLCVYPDEVTTKENMRDRIAPAIKASKRLLEYSTGYDDDFAATRINLQHMTIYGAWANSAARLANKPIGKVVLDEVDKYPDTVGKKEASPVALAELRMRTYVGRRKIWLISSPTVEEGLIWQSYNEAAVRFSFGVRCPECGGWQEMVLSEKDSGGATVFRIRVPEDERDPERIYAESLAWYQCAKCDAEWTDAMRDRAVRKGEWRDDRKGVELFAYLRAFNPKHIAFRIPAWLSFLVSLSEVMKAWFVANPVGKPVNKDKLKNFKNGYEALPWLHYDEMRQDSTILALCHERPMGRVPGGGVVSCLTFGMDTQDDGFWIWIEAWGWGLTMDRWLIRAEFVTTFAAVEQVLWEDAYLDADGRRYQVRFGLQDHQGHRDAEVYDFCRQHPGRILPCMGKDTMNQSFTDSPVEYYPGTKRRVPGNLKRIVVNTKYFKDRLAAALAVQSEAPGSIRFPEDFAPAWASHFTSEFLNDKGLWECPKHKANHLWDCAVYSACAAEVMGVRFWPKPAAEEKPARKPKNAPGPPARVEYERPAWLEDR